MGHSLCSFILRQIPRRSPTHNAVYFTTTRLGGYIHLSVFHHGYVHNFQPRLLKKQTLLLQENIFPISRLKNSF